MSLSPKYQCSPGSAKLAGVCTICPPGTTSLGNLQQMCTLVPKGTYQPLFNATESLDCGTSFFIGAAFCGEYGRTHDCDPGYYYSFNTSSCTPTPAGYYTPLPGAVSYYACPPGTYAPTAASSNCLPMPVGHFGPLSAATELYGECAKTAERESGVNCVTNGFYEAPALATTLVNTTAGLINPIDAIFSPAGILYITEGSGGNRIRQINTVTGRPVTFVGSRTGVSGFADGTGTNTKFSNPQGLTVDSLFRLYVADSGNHRIRRVTTAGVVTTWAGTGISGYVDGNGIQAQFSTPIGVCVDTLLNLYITDNSLLVRRINASTYVTTVAGNLLPTGNIDGVGTFATFQLLLDLAIDTSSGVLWVVDVGANKIRTITTATTTTEEVDEVAQYTVSTIIGNGAEGYTDGAGLEAGTVYPWGIAIDPTNSNVYFTSTGYGLLRLYSTAGIVITLAGSILGNPLTQNPDGIGTAASFRTPQGIAIDPAGNLIIPDSGTNAVRRILLYNVTCSAGEFFNGDFCTVTPPGYYVPPGEPSILYGCPAGSYTTEEGQSTCLESPYGNFTPTSGHDQYYGCPNDTYYFIEGAGECEVISPPPTSFPTRLIVQHKPNLVWLVVALCGFGCCVVGCFACWYCYYACWKDSEEEHHQHAHRHDIDFGIESDTTIQVHAVSDYVNVRTRVEDPEIALTQRSNTTNSNTISSPRSGRSNGGATGRSSLEINTFSSQSLDSHRGDRFVQRQVVTVVRQKHTGAQHHRPEVAQAVGDDGFHHAIHTQRSTGGGALSARSTAGPAPTGNMTARSTAGPAPSGNMTARSTAGNGNYQPVPGLLSSPRSASYDSQGLYDPVVYVVSHPSSPSNAYGGRVGDGDGFNTFTPPLTRSEGPSTSPNLSSRSLGGGNGNSGNGNPNFPVVPALPIHAITAFPASNNNNSGRNSGERERGNNNSSNRNTLSVPVSTPRVPDRSSSARAPVANPPLSNASPQPSPRRNNSSRREEIAAEFRDDWM